MATPAVGRVLGAGGATAGSCLILGRDRAVTCAHVVQKAGAGKGGEVRIDWNGQVVAAIVEQWTEPEAEDVAGLRLATPLEGAPHAALAASQLSHQKRVATFGFPSANPVGGLRGEGEVLGPVTVAGQQVLQVRSQEIGRASCRERVSIDV